MTDYNRYSTVVHTLKCPLGVIRKIVWRLLPNTLGSRRSSVILQRTGVRSEVTNPLGDH